MSIVIGILTFALILVSLFLGLVVLIQKPRSDSGLGASMGGGMAEATFGAETGNVLTRATIYAAVAFFVIAFALYVGQLHVVKTAGKRDARLPVVPASALPAVPTPSPQTAPTTPAPIAQPASATPAPTSQSAPTSPAPTAQPEAPAPAPAPAPKP